ncbi:glutathione hydrolase 1 proenzyme-like [Glandiceps talaboti]
MPGEKRESRESINKGAQSEETHTTPVGDAEKSKGSEKQQLLTSKEKEKHRTKEEKKEKEERDRGDKERRREEKRQREKEKREKQRVEKERRKEEKGKKKTEQLEKKTAEKEREKEKKEVEKDKDTKKKGQKGGREKDKSGDTSQKPKKKKEKQGGKKGKAGNKEGAAATVRPGEIRRVEKRPDLVELEEIEDIDQDNTDGDLKDTPTPSPSPIQKDEDDNVDPEKGVDDIEVKPKKKRKLSTGQRLVIVAAVIIALVTILALIIAIIVAVKMTEDHQLMIPVTPPKSSLLPDGQYEYHHAAVASDHTTCSEIGRGLLEQGGSAVDAAIATALCLGVVQGQSSGIGGGFIMTIYDKENGEKVVIDARETAPQAAARRMCSDNRKLCKYGPSAAGVPGAVRGYKEAHSRYGILPWSALFQPAITLTERGFTVTEQLAKALRSVSNDTTEAYNNYTVLWMLFSNQFNTVSVWDWYRAGENMTRPALGQTLRRLAKYGANDFYNRDGFLAQRLIRDITDGGGIMTADDLENYKVEIREALNVSLQNNYTVVTAPPPAGGAPLAFLFNFMEDSKFIRAQTTAHGVAKLYHQFIEACKFSFDGFSQLGDPGFVKATPMLNELLSKGYADDIRATIHIDRPTFNNSEEYSDEASVDSPGSTHISVIAENGDAVSMTSSINSYFGSRFVSTGTGVILNNQMDSFTIPPADDTTLKESPNYIEGGKRPRSPMAPTLVIDNNGNVTMVIGGAGGNTVIPSIAMVVLQSLLSNQTLAGAVKGKRMYGHSESNKVVAEKGFSQKILDMLKVIGYNIEESADVFAIIEAILVQDGVIKTARDPRKPGLPAGY